MSSSSRPLRSFFATFAVRVFLTWQNHGPLTARNAETPAKIPEKAISGFHPALLAVSPRAAREYTLSVATMRRRAFRSVDSFLFAILLVTILISNLAVPGYGQSAQDLTGKALDPFLEASGKIVVLVFLRTDCPISNRYAPSFNSSAGNTPGRRRSGLSIPMRKHPLRAFANT